jgi:excisionase family DNA binding protein
MATTDQLEELMSLLDGDVRLTDSHGHEVLLAADVAEAFQAAVAEMLANDANELTTEEAAKLIGVSRPTLIRLLDAGAIPFRRTHGDSGHRRIARRAALDYLRAELVRRRSALDELAADAEAFGFFDD